MCGDIKGCYEAMNCWEHVQYTYLIICCLLALLASSKTRSSCSRSYKCPLFKMQAVEVGSFLRRENREKSDTHHEKQGNQQIAATQPTWIDRACHTSKQWRNGSVNGVKANAFNALQVHWIQPQAMMSHNVTENQKARKIAHPHTNILCMLKLCPSGKERSSNADASRLEPAKWCASRMLRLHLSAIRCNLWILVDPIGSFHDILSWHVLSHPPTIHFHQALVSRKIRNASSERVGTFLSSLQQLQGQVDIHCIGI